MIRDVPANEHPELLFGAPGLPMSQARIVVDTESIDVSGAGNATGGIWLNLGKEVFPDRDWNDFVVLILEAMVTALLRLLSGASTRERVHFMDGPYVVDLILVSPSSLRVSGIDRGHEEVERASIDVTLLALAAEIADTAACVVTICEGEKFWSSDAKKLERQVHTLRSELQSRRN